MKIISYEQMANAIRQLSADAVEKANSGHPGMPMGMADIATILFGQHMRFSPQNPQWVNRDRLILSNGHGSMLLYSLLYFLGYPGITLEQIQNFRQLHSLTPGHPEYDPQHGIETTTGPLGQGLANAVGMAIAETHLRAKFGPEIIDHYTYVFVGDGCLMEGITHEAMSLAGKLGLGKLIVLWDSNQVTIDGSVEMVSCENVLQRIESYGWSTNRIDGHSHTQIHEALIRAKKSSLPSFIECCTKIGRGSPSKEGHYKTHGAPLGKEELESMRAGLNVSSEPFVIHKDILETWQDIGVRAHQKYEEWKQAYDALPLHKQKAFEEFTARKNLSEVVQSFIPLKKKIYETKVDKATRQWSQDVLNWASPSLPNLIGGSADLTSSNNTKAEDMVDYDEENLDGRYINYGVREHAMASIMSGLSLHEGIIPYAGTFLVFTDYMRPAIRLAALMKRPVIYVMTHDSIGLGEDGPTHQPIEHLNSLRLIPNVLVLRPMDGIETVECWEIALQNKSGPSILCLSRQTLKSLRTSNFEQNMCAKGAYALNDVESPDFTLIATGSEVELAVGVAQEFERDKVACRVVSMPCQELFFQQSITYQQQLFPDIHKTISIEAGSIGLWRRIVGSGGLCIGVDTFGHSAPYKKIYEAFGLTVPAIVGRIREKYNL